MAARSYFIPGRGYINEVAGVSYFVPGWNYINETSQQRVSIYIFSGANASINGHTSSNIFLTPYFGLWPSGVTINLSDTAGTPGTFTPSSLTPTVDTNTPASFTYTPAQLGAFTLVSNSGGSMTDPAPWAFTSVTAKKHAHGAFG